MKKNTLFLLLVACISIVSCRKKELPIAAKPTPNNPTTNKGNIHIKLNNVVGTTPLALGDLVSYTLSNGETFSVTTYNYYLSNFVLTDEHGNKYVETESYHLAMASNPESLNFTLKNVPFEKYVSVEFVIGVDSVRNFSGAQDGDLDPKYGMIWSWSTGYIMAKLEGSSAQSSNPNKSISYHIAGYKGEYNVLQKVKLSLPSSALVDTVKTPSISLQSNIATWFESFTFPGFSKLPNVGTEGKNAFDIAMNYSSMMSITKVENP